MHKNIHPTPEQRVAQSHARLRKSMPPEEFARLVEADGALKWCGKCRQLLPVSEFRRLKGAFDGLQRRCESCAKAQITDYRQRNRARANDRAAAWRKANPDKVRRTSKKMRLKAYNLTPDLLDAMIAERRGRCDICKRRFKDRYDTIVDHDHACCPGVKSCGECIRGLLCRACNIGLGKFRDNPTVMHRAIRYLELGQAWRMASAPDDGQGLLWGDPRAA